MTFDLSQILRQFQQGAQPRSPTNFGVPGMAPLRTMAGDQPMLPPTPDPFNNRRPPSSLPYADRFAGGMLKSSYTPYQGDIRQYGLGAQHRNFTPDTTAWTTSTDTNTSTTPSGPQRLSLADWQQRDPNWRAAHPELAPEGYESDSSTYNPGGSDPGDGASSGQRDQRSFSGISEFVNDPQVRQDATALAQMASPIGGAINAALGDPLGWGGNQPSIADLAAANTSANPDSTRSANDPDGIGINGPAGASPGVDIADAMSGLDAGYAKGGIVKGDKKLGKDDTTIRADGGEGVVRAAEMKKIGADFLRKLNTGAYDAGKLRRAVGLK